METILVKPRNKEELELVSSILKHMKIRSFVQKKEMAKKKKAKAEFLDSLEGRLKEVQQHVDGKIKLKSWDELFNSL